MGHSSKLKVDDTAVCSMFNNAQATRNRHNTGKLSDVDLASHNAYIYFALD
jgi:hypothetical protein